MARGDIRWFRFSEKRRPVLVLSRDDMLPFVSQVIVMPFSTQVRGLQWEVPVTLAHGLPDLGVLKPEWTSVVDRKALGPWIASLPSHVWPNVRQVLLHVVGFDPPTT